MGRSKQSAAGNKSFTKTRMASQDIGVTPHRSFNSFQGVISETDLFKTDADLFEALKDQGVMELWRLNEP